MNTYIREPINALTHLGGAVLAFIGLLAMVIKVCIVSPTVISISAIIIFGVSMILLYTASATYHTIIGSKKIIFLFRKVDHSMIYILIAGSYTPFCLITLNNTLGWVLFVVISTLAILGVVFKLSYFHAPRWISTTIYIFMGWLIIFVSKPLFAVLPIAAMLLLIGGGILYTIGGVIYGVKPKFMSNKYFGFHEIFHIFILIGSLAHFLCVFLYVI